MSGLSGLLGLSKNVEAFSALTGRRLLWDELVYYIRSVVSSDSDGGRRELSEDEIRELVGVLQRRGLVEVMEGVSLGGERGRRVPGIIGPVCNRCGGTEQVYIRACATCGSRCATCEECINQGRSKTCTPLVYFKPEGFAKDLIVSGVGSCGSTSHEENPSAYQTHLPITYSPAQEAALESIDRFLEGASDHTSNGRSFLLWAVTGAGKTELCYPAISQALARGHKVLFTAPRKDVIRELATRFKRDFPNSRIAALYGGSEDRWLAADLYLATVQQVLRFYQYFDLVIIDELDAFPYHNNPRLQYYVDRAIKPGGQRILMSATPPVEWIKELAVPRRRVDTAFHILPRRFHGHPLPVPEIIITRDYRRIIGSFLEQVTACQGQGLIFIPQIAQINIWRDRLTAWFPENDWAGVYAAASDRDERVEEFRAGDLRFLLTTTILERGVTFANLHVLVLDAADQVWDEATLVQIAGRVGRNKNYPTGLVWFLAPHLTRAMKAAKKQIQRMNAYE